MQKAIDAGEATEEDMKPLSRSLQALTDTSDQSARIEIEGVAYPGVTVKIFGVQYSFITERSHCRIRLDEHRKITVIPLS